MASVEESKLGKQTRYDHAYDSALLFPISRADNRHKLSDSVKDFVGEDWWTSYELSWLQPSGLPVAAIAHFRVPSDSANIIESKSFKLYLNSLNQHTFESVAELRDVLTRDLSKAATASVDVQIELVANADFSISEPAESEGQVCLDSLTPGSEAFVYAPDAQLLRLALVAEDESEVVEESLYSHLLRSNCPVTDQPDWGSVYIEYRGPKIDHESLLRYIISFRQCQDFHEHCVERMFCDVLAQCQCESLSVYARYTRRGGLDINPYRTTPDRQHRAPSMRTVRQ